MRYKSTNDIPWIKFQEFISIEEPTEDDIISIFETKDFDAFNNALLKNDFVTIPFKVDMSFSNAAKFIDCDTLMSENNMIDFLKLVVKKKYFWQRKINFDKISVAQVQYVSSLFTFAQPK